MYVLNKQLTRYLWLVSGSIIRGTMLIVSLTAGGIASAAEKVWSNILLKIASSALS